MLTKGFFQLARAAAMQSDHRYKVGCVLVKNGKPVSVGFNITKTHPQFTDAEHPSIHAEVKAILNARCDLRNATAYVYRETKRGNPALAKPCANCRAYLIEAGIKNVFFTISSEPYWQEERLK